MAFRYACSIDWIRPEFASVSIYGRPNTAKIGPLQWLSLAKQMYSDWILIQPKQSVQTLSFGSNDYIPKYFPSTVFLGPLEIYLPSREDVQAKKVG